MFRAYTTVHQQRAGVPDPRLSRDFRKSCRMFNEAFDRVFLAKRPWLRTAPRTFMGEGPAVKKLGRPASSVARETAEEFLSVQPRPFGYLKELCQARGANLNTVRSLLGEIRQARGLKAMRPTSGPRVARTPRAKGKARQVAEQYLALPASERWGLLPGMCRAAGVSVNTVRVRMRDIRRAARLAASLERRAA